MPKDPPLPDCKLSLTQANLLPLVFTLAFSVFAYCHCRWARDPFISAALAYNLIILVNNLHLLAFPDLQMFLLNDLEG